MKLSEYLRTKRFKENLTSAEAAEKVGITPYYYSFLENGKVSNPHKGTVEKLASYTGLDVKKIKEMLNHELHK